MIVVFNESLIEIDEFDESLNVQNADKNELREYKVDFDEIHANFF